MVYILWQKRGGVAYVSGKRQRFDLGPFCRGLGSRDPDRRDLSGGGAAVSGGVFADRLRLRLLPASLERSFYEHRSLEIAQVPAKDSAKIVPRESITSPGNS